MRTVLFICTGNTCRSPMAEAIGQAWLKSQAAEGAPGTPSEWLVASAGVAAGDGVPIAAEARHTLEAMGIDHDGRSRMLTVEMIQAADLILGMTASHVDAARSMVADSPDDIAKIHTVDPEGDIDDPIGLGQAAYEAVAERLQVVIPKRLRELFVEGSSS